MPDRERMIEVAREGLYAASWSKWGVRPTNAEAQKLAEKIVAAILALEEEGGDAHAGLVSESSDVRGRDRQVRGAGSASEGEVPSPTSPGADADSTADSQPARPSQVPQEAIEAVAARIYEQEYELPFSTAPALKQGYYREEARRALEAALPAIRKQIVEEMVRRSLSAVRQLDFIECREAERDA